MRFGIWNEMILTQKKSPRSRDFIIKNPPAIPPYRKGKESRCITTLQTETIIIHEFCQIKEGKS